MSCIVFGTPTPATTPHASGSSREPRTCAPIGGIAQRLVPCRLFRCFSAIAMAMRLHAFGLKHEDTRRPPTSASVPVLQARSIRVLWAAWCDALITYSSNLDGDGDGGEPWVLLYTGTGLTAAQKESLTGDADLKRAIAGVDKGSEVVFFGSSMHDGLRGYVVRLSACDTAAPHGR